MSKMICIALGITLVAFGAVLWATAVMSEPQADSAGRGWIVYPCMGLMEHMDYAHHHCEREQTT